MFRHALAVAASVLTCASALSAPIAAAAPASLKYVAMGDSWAAGTLTFPLAEGSNPLCVQSSHNPGRQLAERAGLHLTDVTCGNASPGDVLGRQYGVLPPQIDGLTPDTDLVSLTMGGNNNNTFVIPLVACTPAAVSTGSTGSPCADLLGQRFADQIRTDTYAKLVDNLRAIRERAPRARVALSTYQEINPADHGCPGTNPVADGDLAYLRMLQDTLNDAIRRAAAAEGAILVDMARASPGHDSCQPVGVRWVDPIVGGPNFVSTHPSEEGMRVKAEMTGHAFGLF